MAMEDRIRNNNSPFVMAGGLPPSRERLQKLVDVVVVVNVVVVVVVDVDVVVVVVVDVVVDGHLQQK